MQYLVGEINDDCIVSLANWRTTAPLLEGLETWHLLCSFKQPFVPMDAKDHLMSHFCVIVASGIAGVSYTGHYLVIGKPFIPFILICWRFCMNWLMLSFHVLLVTCDIEPCSLPYPNNSRISLFCVYFACIL